MVNPVSGEIMPPNEKHTWVRIVDGKLVVRHINKHTMDFLELVEATGMQLVKIETDPIKQLTTCPNLYFRNKYIPNEYAKIFYDNNHWNISLSEKVALNCKSMAEVFYPLLRLLEDHVYAIQFHNIVKEYLGLNDKKEEEE